MTSSPYQSNLLRFFVRQYRQGMNRHRLAVRKTRSSIALGSELGLAIAMTPAYAVLRTTQRLSTQVGKTVKTIGNAIDKLHLPATQSEANDLLDLSGFDSLPTLQALEDEAVTDSGDCDANSKVLVTSEWMMAKVLMMTGQSLSPTQRKQLSAQVSRWQLFTAKAKRFVESLSLVRSPARLELSQEAEQLEVAQLKTIKLEAKNLETTNNVVVNESKKITGLASDISTRSLVLVLGHTTIWDGLSANQKKQIQAQIDTFWGTSETAQKIVVAPPSLLQSISTSAISNLETWCAQSSQSPVSQNQIAHSRTSQSLTLRNLTSQDLVVKVSSSLSVLKNDLVRPIYSFWLAVLQMMSSWFRRDEDPSAPKPLASGRLKLPMLSMLLPRVVNYVLNIQLLSSISLVDTPLANVLQPSGHSTFSIQCAPCSHTTRTATELEATVISVDYIEHPLEKVLKWLDRFLLWLENGWQRIWNWQQRRSE